MPPTLLFLSLLLQTPIGQKTLVEADPTAWLKGAGWGALVVGAGAAFTELVRTQIKRWFDQRDKQTALFQARLDKVDALESAVSQVQARLTRMEEQHKDTHTLADESSRRSSYNEGRFKGFEDHMQTIQDLLEGIMQEAKKPT